MSGGNVLMVEPNPGILIVARNVLARAGYGVLAVSNARQGVKLVEQRRAAVVLLDAKQAGPEVLESLARLRQDVLQLILTVQKGRDALNQDVAAQARRLGLAVAEVLEKPFAPERLLSAVDLALARALGTRTDLNLDTLVNVDAVPFEEEGHEGAKTDIFPFAHLLQGGSGLPEEEDDPFDDDTNFSVGLDGRQARRAALIRASLERDGLAADPRLMAACVRACEAAVDLEPDPPVHTPTDGAQLVVAGYVGHLAIDQILQLPTAVDGVARCRLELDRAVIDIFYDGPHVVFARQDNLPDGFMLGRLLVAEGLVREDDVEAVLDPRRGLSGWLGQRLVHQGLLSADGVRAALRRQTEELVYEVVRWREGRFSVFAREPLAPEAARARLRIPVQHLLLEGMRRLDEWRRIEGQVGDLAAVLRPLVTNQEVVRALSAEDRLVLSHVDGRRTVAELVRSVARPSFEVFRALHSLADRKLVAVGG
jgi:CheY-like chemotaxis protein